MMALMSISVVSGAAAGGAVCKVSVILSSSGATIILYSPSRRRTPSLDGEALTFMKTAKTDPFTVSTYLHYFEERRDALLETVRQMAEMESPSFSKASVDLLGTWLAARFGKLGGVVRVDTQPRFGNHLRVDFPGRSAAGSRKLKPILLLGHFDTVYELGTLARMPCRIQKGRLYGPGVFDMKSGIAFMLHAIEALQAVGGGLPRPGRGWVWTGEVVGSESSPGCTEQLTEQRQDSVVHGALAGAKCC